MDDKNGFYGVELPHVQHFTTFLGVEPVQHHHWIAAISMILEGVVFSRNSTMGDIFPNMEPNNNVGPASVWVTSLESPSDLSGPTIDDSHPSSK